MNLIEIFSIFLIHWFADFVLQTDKQAKGKSKNWSDLLSHTFTYSMVWLVAGIAFCFIVGFNESIHLFKLLLFVVITFTAHTITDYFISRLNSKLWSKATYWGGDDIKRLYSTEATINQGKYVHNFFVSVGFDQVLHYIQLFTTYYFLKSI